MHKKENSTRSAMRTNPYMMMLKANPAKYIQKPAATLLTLAKAAEGILALFILIQLLFGGMGTSAGAETTADWLLALLPGEALPYAQPIHAAMGDALFVLAGLCCLVGLVCTVAEALVLLALRFAMTGAGALKNLHRVIHLDCCALLLTVFVAFALRIYRFFTLEFRQDPLLQTIRPVLIGGGAALVLLVLLMQYHADIVTVLTAVDFEFRLGYKETMVEVPALSKLSPLFAVLLLAGAVLLGLREGLQSLRVIGMTVLALKFFSVSQSWEDFRLCHR